MSHQLLDDAATRLNDVDRQTLEWRLVEFDRGWTPDRLAQEVERLLAVGPALRRALLAEMVKIDLERQWARGQRLPLETYLGRYADLGGTDNVAPELIQAEYEVRRHFGESDPLPGICDRFPGQGEDVRRLVERASEIVSERELSHVDSETVGSVAMTETFRPRRGSTVGLPENFGRYRIIKSLGKGGMGAVYLAHDSQLDRQVALKVPHFADEDGPDVRERFYREARAAATLTHPNLCPVYDVGEHDGIHFLTMAYIDGHPLSHFIKAAKPQPPRQVAAVVRKLALALHEAHGRGVIHRDLKPSNIMIDRRREPVVMDFGLARRANSQDIRLTQSGAAIGTPAYMPPEQVRGDMAAIGAGCDIYSLGVILYELLTGRLPFRGNVADVLVQILTVETPPPSQFRPEADPRLAEICLKAMSKRVEDRYASMGALAAALTEYLRAVPAPALGASERAAEKQGAIPSALVVSVADDLANQFFADMSSAQLSTPLLVSRQAKSVRRNSRWNAAIVGGLFAAVAIVFGVVFIINGNRVEVPDGSVVAVRPNGEIHIQTPPAAQAEESAVEADEESARVDSAPAPTGLDRPVHVAADEESAQVDAAASSSVEASESPAPTADTATIALDGSQPTGMVRAYEGHAGGVFQAKWTPDQARFLSAGWDGTLRLWDASTGRELRRWNAHSGTVCDIDFSDDGRRVVSSGEDGAIRLWDLERSEPARTFLGHGGNIFAVRFLPGDERLLSCGHDRTLRIWNVASGLEESCSPPQPTWLRGIALCADPRFAVVSGGDPKLRKWDVQANVLAAEFVGHTDGAICVAASTDLPIAASGGRDAAIRIWDLQTDKALATLTGHANTVHGLDFSADGQRLLSASYDGTIRLWDVAAGQELERFDGHTDRALSVDFSADGQYALSAGVDRTIRLWRLPELDAAAEPAEGAPAAAEPIVLNVSAPDLAATKVLADVDWTKSEPQILDETEARIRGVDEHGFYYRSLRTGTWAWNVQTSPSLDFACELVGRVADGGPDDAWMMQVGTLSGAADAHRGIAVAVTAGGSCRVGRSVFDQSPTAWLESREIPNDAILPGAEFNVLRVLVRGGLLEIYINGVAIGEPIRLAEKILPARVSIGIQARNGPARVDLSRITLWDGDQLTPGGMAQPPGVVARIALDGTQPPGLIHTFSGHTAEVHAVAFSADGRLALSGGRDKSVRLWDLETAEELTRFVGHTEELLSVAFAPDGEHALSAGVDQVVRVWRLSDGQQTAEWKGHNGSITNITVLANGRHVSATGLDGVARLWDWSTGRELSRIEGPSRAAVAPDGRRALTAAADGTLRVFDGRSGEALRQLVGHTGRVIELAITRDGRHGLTTGFDDETVRLWDLGSGTELRRLVGHSGKVLGLAFTPDGRRAVTACGGQMTVDGFYVSGTDQSIRVWDVATGEELAKFLGHRGSARDVTCSPDGRYALSAGGDDTVRLWRLPD